MSYFDSVIREIEAIDGCDRTKNRVLSVLKRHRSVIIGVIPLRSRDRFHAIDSLRNSEVPRHQHAAILAQRWGCSIATAYWWLRKSNERKPINK